MANAAVQWTVTKFWSQLQRLSDAINAVSAQLAADRTQLSQLYSRAKAEPAPRGAQDRALLEPLIHRNSVLRMTYLAPIKSKFTEAVSAAARVLKSAGYTPPGLSGVSDCQLGVLPAVALVPLVAVAAVLVGLEAIAIVNNLTAAQRQRTAAIAAIMADQGTTTEEKKALAKTITEQTKQESKANPPLFDPGAFALPLALVAIIALGPSLLRLLPGRRAAA